MTSSPYFSSLRSKYFPIINPFSSQTTIGSTGSTFMTSVYMDSGFEMNNVQCIDCDQTIFYFNFQTKNFTIYDAKLANINSGSDSSTEYLNGLPGPSSNGGGIKGSSPYPSIFRIEIKSNDTLNN